jgi:hypothetical protein
MIVLLVRYRDFIMPSTSHRGVVGDASQLADTEAVLGCIHSCVRDCPHPGPVIISRAFEIYAALYSS